MPLYRPVRSPRLLWSQRSAQNSKFKGALFLYSSPSSLSCQDDLSKLSNLASKLAERLVQCIRHEIVYGENRTCTQGGILFRLSPSLHGHGDERWPTEITSNAYCRGVIPVISSCQKVEVGAMSDI